jgi:hypothetical protein
MCCNRLRNIPKYEAKLLNALDSVPPPCSLCAGWENDQMVLLTVLRGCWIGVSFEVLVG